jgi:hypothetical protein
MARALAFEGLDAWIIDPIRTLGTVTIYGLSKLPLKLSSESHLFPMSTIAPDDISGPRPSMGLGGVIPYADGHVYVEGAGKSGLKYFRTSGGSKHLNNRKPKMN